MALVMSEVTGIDESVAIVAVWLSYTLFTLYSGSRGVILTDTVMFVLFSGMIVLAAFFIIQSAGGWFSAIEHWQRMKRNRASLRGMDEWAQRRRGKLR